MKARILGDLPPPSGPCIPGNPAESSFTLTLSFFPPNIAYFASAIIIDQAAVLREKWLFYSSVRWVRRSIV